jgi:hypothetical protein
MRTMRQAFVTSSLPLSRVRPPLPPAASMSRLDFGQIVSFVSWHGAANPSFGFRCTSRPLAPWRDHYRGPRQKPSAVNAAMRANAHTGTASWKIG